MRVFCIWSWVPSPESMRIWEVEVFRTEEELERVREGTPELVPRRVRERPRKRRHFVGLGVLGWRWVGVGVRGVMLVKADAVAARVAVVMIESFIEFVLFECVEVLSVLIEIWMTICVRGERKWAGNGTLTGSIMNTL